MKKLTTAAAVMLVLFLTACSGQNKVPDDANGAQDAQTQTENIIMSEDGEWPENEYTDGLPVPNGTVAWTMTDTENRNFSINITNMAESDCNDYMDQLKNAGFSVTESVSEEIKGQNYVSDGTLLSNGEKALSISYIPDSLTVFISFEK